MLLNNTSQISVNLIPFNRGQKKNGVDKGPSFLMNSKLIEKIESLNYSTSVTEIKSNQTVEELSALKMCSLNCQNIAKAVSEQAKNKQFCLNIGGDHSIGTGTIAGMLDAYPDLCVVWIDAHLDINTAVSSPSGSVHGMPVSFVLDDHRKKSISALPEEYKWCRNRLLSPSKLAYIGIRQADEGEIETVRELNIQAFDMVAIERLGIHECITTALRKIDPLNVRPIHVSFDIDSMDPFHIPSTGTPVKGGLTMREILYVAENIHNTGRLVGLDVVEFNPLVKKNDEEPKLTAKNTISVIKSFLGKRRPQFN